MSKKSILKLGIAVVILSLSVFFNFIFSDDPDDSDFIFNNVEALANDETPGFKPDCVASGFVCTGRDENGNWGQHSGLTISED